MRDGMVTLVPWIQLFIHGEDATAVVFGCGEPLFHPSLGSSAYTGNIPGFHLWIFN